MAGVRILPMPGGSVAAQVLDPIHYEIFNTALSNVLSLEITYDTVCQLMDGLPLYSTVLESAAANNLTGAPIQQHTRLCAGSTENAAKFLRQFDTNSLRFRAEVSTPIISTPTGQRDCADGA